jgi:hypothetical protein
MKKLLKWLGIGLGSLLLLIVAAAIIIPLVVDVDKFRPQIVQAAGERINGKLELGKLSLSLWGQIRVEVQGVTLTDTAGRKVVAVKDAYFHIPFSSILSGSPDLVFKMDHPSIAVIKNKQGKLNVMGLMKPQAVAEAAGKPTTPSGKPATGTPSSGTQLPGLLAHARLGIELSHALVTYKDELTGLDTEVKDLNLVMRDISLTRTTDIELWADFDTKMGKTLSVHGPARLTAHVKPSLVNGAFDHAAVDAKLNLDDLDIVSGAMFEKAKGLPCNADLALTGAAKEIKIEHFVFKFFNANISANGTVTNLGAEPATPGALPPSPIVNMTVASNEIDLKAWNQLVPMLKEYDLAGTAKLDANATGPTDKLGYKAKFAVNGLTAKAPNLKVEPRFDLIVDVITDQIQNMQLTMKAPGNDMTFKGKLVSFTKPQGVFELTSSGMDLDQLINWPPPVAKGAAAAPAAGQPGAPAQGEAKTAAAPAAGGGATKPPVADLDASVDSLRTNPVAAATTVVINTNIKMLKAKNIKMTDMVGKLYLRDLVGGLEGFAMKLWSGTVKANFAAQLRPKMPTYTFSTVTDGLQLKEAVAANVEMIKNTIIGKAHFEMSGAGASFNTEPAMSNLKAKGSMKIENATFGTIDVGKMASEAVNKAIERVAEKVPQVKGKSVGMPGGKESRYDLVSSSFSINEGRFDAPDFATKAAKDSGIDLKGDTQVGLKDLSLKTAWQVIDTYNLLKARDLSVDVAGTQVPHILAEGNGPVKFTVHAGCTCLQPCYSYTEVPEELMKVAVNNVTGAATGRAKEEVRKKIESVIPKSAPPAVQDAIKKFGGGLFK